VSTDKVKGLVGNAVVVTDDIAHRIREGMVLKEKIVTFNTNNLEQIIQLIE
jgi:hypothetical protein